MENGELLPGLNINLLEFPRSMARKLLKDNKDLKGYEKDLMRVKVEVLCKNDNKSAKDYKG